LGRRGFAPEKRAFLRPKNIFYINPKRRNFSPGGENPPLPLFAAEASGGDSSMVVGARREDTHPPLSPDARVGLLEEKENPPRGLKKDLRWGETYSAPCGSPALPLSS